MPSSFVDSRQKGELQFLSNMKELGTFIFPEDEQRRELWFESVQEVWQEEEKEWFLEQMDKEGHAWAVLEYMSTELWMSSDTGYENDTNVFEGRNWFYIDWKDSETSMDFIENQCKHYGLNALGWSVADPRIELNIENQCIEANKQLFPQGYQIWNIDTGGDAYLLVFLRNKEILHFQDLAKRLNMKITNFSLNNMSLEQATQPDAKVPETAPIPWWSRVLGFIALLIFCYVLLKYSMGLFS